jgi:hypothetical protein
LSSINNSVAPTALVGENAAESLEKTGANKTIQQNMAHPVL